VTYRRQQLIALAGLTLATNLAAIGSLGYMARTHYYNEYRAKLLSIASTAAAALDGANFEAVATGGGENTSQFASIQSELREMRNTNRRPDTQIQRLFAVTRSKDGLLRVVADPEEDPRLMGHSGEIYREQGPPLNVDQPKVEDDFSTDEFGRFLRAHAPVRNAQGNVVGAVIAEANVQWVEGKLQPLEEAGLAALAFSIALSIPVAFWLSNRASRPLTELKKAVDTIAGGDFKARASITSKDEFGEVAESVNRMAQGLSERDRVKTAFARYVSQQVMDSVLSSNTGGLGMRGDRRRISVLFSDIRGFSKMSERMPPEKVVQLLNEYFEVMVEVIFRNQGTLDKFMGDGLMAIFGAPENDPYQEEHALKAAVEMQQELEKLQQKWSPEGIQIRIGIGIHSGPAIVGNIGSSRRMEYTAIGDTVNVASRLESATKDLGVSIVVSEHTYYGAKGAFPFRSLGSINIRGREEPLTVYGLDGAGPIRTAELPSDSAGQPGSPAISQKSDPPATIQ